MFWYSNHMNGWGWVFMIFAMVAFWALLISVIFPSRFWGGRPGSSAQVSMHFSPEQLLAGRFARGEIDEPEYTGRLVALRESHQSGDDDPSRSGVAVGPTESPQSAGARRATRGR